MTDSSTCLNKHSTSSEDSDLEEQNIKTKIASQCQNKEKIKKKSNINNIKSKATIKNENDLDIQIKLKRIDDEGPSLPTYNVPEKIIIVLDGANDENHTYFEIMSGKKYSPLFMLQHALKFFLYHKSAINSRHEFALMVLNENSAIWIHDFTNQVQDIIASVRSIIDSPYEPEDIFNLNSVFDLITEKLDLNFDEDLTVPPPFIVRTVLLYGRSYSIPELTRTPPIEKLLNYPYFIVDVIMTHEPPDSANHCIRIFKLLQEIDIKGFSYSFAISRNSADLHCSMAKILSHPLQRSHQADAVYNICSIK